MLLYDGCLSVSDNNRYEVSFEGKQEIAYEGDSDVSVSKLPDSKYLVVFTSARQTELALKTQEELFTERQIERLAAPDLYITQSRNPYTELLNRD